MIVCNGVSKIYRRGQEQVQALKDVTFSVKKGELVGIWGQSGSGKSTLMNVLGCLDEPTAGEYVLDGEPVQGCSSRRADRLRNQKIGFVFQQFYLLPGLTAVENVALPLKYRGVSREESVSRAKEMLEQVGMGDRLAHRPRELSGGQQQRVAVARAMAGNPPLLLADEPTGNLDPASAGVVMDLLKEWQALGNTVILITHDKSLRNACPRQLVLHHGRLGE